MQIFIRHLFASTQQQEKRHEHRDVLFCEAYLLHGAWTDSQFMIKQISHRFSEEKTEDKESILWGLGKAGQGKAS